MMMMMNSVKCYINLVC